MTTAVTTVDLTQAIFYAPWSQGYEHLFVSSAAGETEGRGMTKTVFDQKKFREMMIYVASKSQDDERFGSVKLNKILYYADFSAHMRLGHSISGAEYQHLPEGPAPRQLLPIRKELVETGAAVMEKRPYFNTVQERLVAQRGADLSRFRKEEIEIIDEIIKGLWPLNGVEVTALSHRDAGWLLTKDRDTIPYRTVWLSTEPLSEEQIERGLELAKQYELMDTAVAADAL